MSLNAQLPYYVTRRNADGVSATYSLTAWMILSVTWLVWLNIVGWSFFGLYELISKVL